MRWNAEGRPQAARPCSQRRVRARIYCAAAGAAADPPLLLRREDGARQRARMTRNSLIEGNLPPHELWVVRLGGRICSAMVGVPHHPHLPSLRTRMPGRCKATWQAALDQVALHLPSARMPRLTGQSCPLCRSGATPFQAHPGILQR